MFDFTKLEEDELTDIANGFHPDFEVVSSEIVDTTRWSYVNDAVVKNKDTDEYYSVSFRSAATEYQEDDPIEPDDFVRVYPTVTVSTKVDYLTEEGVENQKGKSLINLEDIESLKLLSNPEAIDMELNSLVSGYSREVAKILETPTPKLDLIPELVAKRKFIIDFLNELNSLRNREKNG